MRSRDSFAIQDHLERISNSFTIFMAPCEALKISIYNSPPDLQLIGAVHNESRLPLDLVHVKEKTTGCST
jgi:hypothetical protein